MELTIKQIQEQSFETAREKGYHDGTINTSKELVLIIGEAFEADRAEKKS